MTMFKTSSALVLIAMISAGAAHAAKPGGFIGGSIGQASYDIDAGAVDNAAVSAGFATSTTTVTDDSDTGWKVWGGYNINENFGVEAGYVDLGTAAVNTVTTGPAATVSTKADVSAVYLAGVGYLPVSDEFDLFAKLGGYQWDSDGQAVVIVGGVGTTVTASDDGTDLMFGLGASWAVTDNVSVRAEWERFADAGDDSIDFISLGVGYHF